MGRQFWEIRKDRRAGEGGAGKGGNLAPKWAAIIIKYFPNCKKMRGLRDARKIKPKCTRRWLFWQSKFLCNHF